MPNAAFSAALPRRQLGGLRDRKPARRSALRTDACFYRTRAGTEIDLLLPNRERWAIEIKLSSAPRIGKGFFLAAADVGASERFVVHSGSEAFPLSADTLAIPLPALMARLAALD